MPTPSDLIASRKFPVPDVINSQPNFNTRPSFGGPLLALQQGKINSAKADFQTNQNDAVTAAATQEAQAAKTKETLKQQQTLFTELNDLIVGAETNPGISQQRYDNLRAIYKKSGVFIPEMDFFTIKTEKKGNNKVSILKVVNKDGQKGIQTVIVTPDGKVSVTPFQHLQDGASFANPGAAGDKRSQKTFEDKQKTNKIQSENNEATARVKQMIAEGKIKDEADLRRAVGLALSAVGRGNDADSIDLIMNNASKEATPGKAHGTFLGFTNPFSGPVPGSVVGQ